MNLLRKLALALCLICVPCLCSCNNNVTNSTGDSSGSASSADELDFPNYIEPSEAAYEFEEKQMITPYWKGNVIYNETVMLIDEGDGTARGKLQYTPIKILSVRDYKFEEEFKEGIDYTVDGRTINRTQASAMPYLTRDNVEGKNIPEPYRRVDNISDIERDYMMVGGVVYTEGSLIYGHQIAVSYVYDVKELNADIIPTYKNSGLPKLKAKLAGGEDVKIVITGDSVAEGCSSSSHFNRPPYMPNFMQMAVTGLQNAYPEANIQLSNKAKGGMTSEWGAADVQINGIIAAQPDVVYIHFGINDCGGSVGASTYIDNLQALILGVRQQLPDCEFVIIKAFTPNPMAYNMLLMEKYWQRVDAESAKMEDVYTLDMYTLSTKILEKKGYTDVTGNGINHLNDYSSRLYAMAVISSLTE